MKSVFSIEYSLGHPHIGLLYQFILGEKVRYTYSKCFILCRPMCPPLSGDDIKGYNNNYKYCFTGK
jgi:hypothetical protein